MNLTKIISPVFNARLKKIDLYNNQAGSIQQKVFNKLIGKASDTIWGQRYSYRTIHNYDDFRSRLPIQTYEEIKPYIERMRQGERNVLWPGKVCWFAKSSGTTNDKSKYIPVSKDGLRDTHYRGGQDVVALYLRSNPQSKLFDGKALILGGSHRPNDNTVGLVGDLSAILIENINPLVNLIRVPSKKVALMGEWETKLRTIAANTIPCNVTNLSGVPSWMLVLIKHILNTTGKNSLHEVWPNLEVFFHGGVAFMPYRAQYNQVINPSAMRYMETYNASEGYFGSQSDLSDPSMLLMIDYGVFYEFIPISQLGNPNPRALCLEEVELGQNYAMVISTSSGLWRYMIGDTVKFTSKNPYKFIITGRTKHFINAFGEELIVDNAERGLAEACQATNAQITEYSAAPVFMDANAKCRHQWLIEFAVPPSSMELFVSVLDDTLKKVNSDYEAKRWKDIALQLPEIVMARTGLFHDWLAQKGKLGGQNKIPRLSNTREYLDSMLQLNK